MQISEHHVRECAYFIWENEGRLHGQAAAHWTRAETELRANAALAAATTMTETVPAGKVAPAAAAKVAAPKVAAPKVAAPKVAAKVAAPQAAAPKAAKPVAAKAAAKPTAPKPVRASKAAVTAGLTAKAKPVRTPAAMH